MATPGTVLRECDPHTRTLLQVVGAYLRARLPALLATYGTATYADGFAGSGVHATGEPGAPVIACRELVAALRGGSGDGARLVLVEADERRLSRLTYEVAVNGVKDQRVRTSYEHGECADTLIPALADSEASEGSMFVFLDGRGRPSVPFDVLAALGAHEASEVLMRVEPRRLAGFGDDPTRCADGDVVFGGAHWREAFDLPPDREGAHLIDAYRYATFRSAGFARTLTVEMIDDSGEQLYLIFGTNQPRGVAAMKDAIWGVDPACGVRYRDPSDPARRELAIGPRPDVGPLREAVLAYVGNGDKGATVNELRNHIANDTIYKDSQVLGVVRRLIAERQLENRTAGRLAGHSFIGRPTYVTGSLF
jgi:three-Cys-motif partner protein